MPGSFDFDPPPQSLTGYATPQVVCRYDAEEGYALLPNIWCERIDQKEGAVPHTAQFSYILDDTAPVFPSQFEQLWPVSSPPNAYKVQCGDRLVVLTVDANGDYRVAFDGFAQVPQTDLEGRSQAVSFVAVHVSVRLWDQVVTGRWQRDGSTPTTPGEPFQTALPTRFNPDDLPNCTPDNYDEEDEEGSGDKWPVFIEPKLQPVGGVTQQTYWNLSKLVRYMLWYYNDEEYVENPDFSALDDLLSNRTPKSGVFYNPGDSSTYSKNPIVIRDYDATNKPPMEVIERQLEYAGFRMRFVCEGTAGPSVGGVTIEVPWNRIEVYRFDAAGPAGPKTISLQPTGSPMDPTLNNVAAFSAASDFHSVANQWTVETKPTYFEIGVLLAPGFQPAAGDETPANRKKWLKSNLDDATADARQKYRLYVGDECGEGHWDLTGGSWITGQRLLLADVFTDEEENPEGNYVVRYRPGLNSLFSVDNAGKPYKAQVMISRDYDGADPPCIWDGTGTWQLVGGGWDLLKDRLGVYINIENPMEWDIGKPNPAAGTPQEPSGVLDAVTSIANPGTAQRQKKFYLMLVTVIEGDSMIFAQADARPASPYPFTVARQVDAKDHFHKTIVDYSSPLSASRAGGLEGMPTTLVDDTPFAQTYAEQMRTAHEFPPIAASVTIPWFTRSYQIGDRIGWIDGRNVSLQTNAGAEQSEAPAYPYVVGMTWNFSGSQKTILQLSDRRTEPAPFRR